MKIQRFMRADDFVRELEPLRVFRSEFVGTNLLEHLDATGLLQPRLRVRYPDPIARRFWLATHDHISRQMKLPLEPDGQRWDAAVDLSNALYRWQNFLVYGYASHPLDELDPRFAEFIQMPKDFTFERRIDRRVDVSNDVCDVLFDDGNVEDYYTSWQILYAAEVADAGIHMRINLADKVVARTAVDAIGQGRIPEGVSCSYNLIPVHAAHHFAEHENALDAVVWFAEERGRVFSTITMKHGGKRFRFSRSESAEYEQASQDLALASVSRFRIRENDFSMLIRFLAASWSSWNRDGRPRIADAYKKFLGYAVVLARRAGNVTFEELRDRIGKVDGGFEPILDVVWPNWADQEKERAGRTLKAAITSGNPDRPTVTDVDIEAFVNFLATEGLEAFFWRLKSFENHALHGNEFALKGMKSDLQGMAIAVEHIVAALGGTATQLHEKFKQVWRNPYVLRLLKRGDVARLARAARLVENWPELKAGINSLRDEPGGKIAADLVMAQRIRGSVHTVLPEDDHFELEALFIGLMRAALLTFVEVRRSELSAATTEMKDAEVQ